MKRLVALWTVGCVAACSALPTQPVNTGVVPVQILGDRDRPSGPICRIGPDGGPVVADRGIGGTGAPAVADRGIGGTGVVGVITGFASICVNGMEVRYDDTAAVDIEGVPASAAALRVGQVVAIRTHGSESEPVASTISVRHEVTGPIESVDAPAGLLVIAGQRVAVPGGFRNPVALRLGNWISASGLRGPAGTLVATRLDIASGPAFSVHGMTVQSSGVLKVGELVVDGPAGSTLADGQAVTLSGRYTAGRARITSSAPDTLTANPGAYFGPATTRLVVEAFVQVAGGSLRLNGTKVDEARDVTQLPRASEIAIVSMSRKPDGTFAAFQMKPADLRFSESKEVSAPRRQRANATPIARRAVLTNPNRADGARSATPLVQPSPVDPPSQPNHANGAAVAPTMPTSDMHPSTVPVGNGKPEGISPDPASPTSDLISSNTRPSKVRTARSTASRPLRSGPPPVLLSGTGAATSVPANGVNVLTSAATPLAASPGGHAQLMVSSPKAGANGKKTDGKSPPAATGQPAAPTP